MKEMDTEVDGLLPKLTHAVLSPVEGSASCTVDSFFFRVVQMF